MEEALFKKSIFLENKLEEYGFQKNNDKYQYITYINDNKFQVIIDIENNNIKGKIIDLQTKEEYLNYRNLNFTGSYVEKIRGEYLNILNDIKDKCTINNLFIAGQANRLVKLAQERLPLTMDFPWENEGHAVLRHQDNQKWFALIMEINKNKLTKENKLINIINLKLDELEIQELLKKPGFFKAYHMHKGKWITILLDDTISDEEIWFYIEKSFTLTK